MLYNLGVRSQETSQLPPMFLRIFHLQIFLLGSQPPGKECDYLDHSAIRSPSHIRMPRISALVKTLVGLSVKASIAARQVGE